jgi:hypothetical protein
MPLFCQYCGQEHPSLVNVCPRCGHPQPPLPTPPRRIVTLSQPSTDELRGVEGWLLFLCISLTFIAPVAQVLVAEKAVRNLATARLPVQTALRLGSVVAIYAGLAIFSCIAGVMLWMENPKGVKVAKAYLLVGTVLPISIFLLMHLSGMHVELFRIAFRRLFSSVIWYSYLTISRRVKRTYG